MRLEFATSVYEYRRLQFRRRGDAAYAQDLTSYIYAFEGEPERHKPGPGRVRVTTPDGSVGFAGTGREPPAERELRPSPIGVAGCPAPRRS